MGHLLILGAGYLGAALAEQALAEGARVTLADNWYATERGQLDGLQERGAAIETADIRSADDLDRLLSLRPEKVYLLAAQASRPVADRDPDYTEQTNITGARRVAEAVGAAGNPLVYASSLNVYGHDLRGVVTAEHPYGPQSDLAHLSKIYGELCLTLHANRYGFSLAILRLGILYGPSPVEHESPDSQTVIDKFRRLSAAGEPLALDDGGRATIGAAHVEDAARILLEAPAEEGVSIANVAAETLTVADVAALVRGEQPPDDPAGTFQTPFSYRHRVADYLSRSPSATDG
jgi:UDP-glucose 4-epimerase